MIGGSNRGFPHHKTIARRPRWRGSSCARTERSTGSFNMNVVPLPAGASVRVPPFRSASWRAITRP